MKGLPYLHDETRSDLDSMVIKGFEEPALWIGPRPEFGGIVQVALLDEKGQPCIHYARGYKPLEEPVGGFGPLQEELLRLVAKRMPAERRPS